MGMIQISRVCRARRIIPLSGTGPAKFVGLPDPVFLRDNPRLPRGGFRYGGYNGSNAAIYRT